MLSSPLYGCRLGAKYIDTTSFIVKYPEFEHTIVKLQRGKERSLTDGEKLFVIRFRKISGAQICSGEEGTGMAECKNSTK